MTRRALLLARVMCWLGYTKIVEVTPHVARHSADTETLWSTYRWVWRRRGWMG